MSRYDDEYKKVCPYCEIEFEAKRTNQKFCRNKCKYTFNNRLRRNKDRVKAPDIRVLDNNHSVLKLMYQKNTENQKQYSKSDLKEKGFDFEYLTRNAISTKGKQVIGIYDIALFQEKDGLFTIKKIA